MRGKSPPPRGSEGHPTHTVNRLNRESRTGRLLIQAGILNQKSETTKKAAGRDKVVTRGRGVCRPSILLQSPTVACDYMVSQK
jgi:hypothetical protein